MRNATNLAELDFVDQVGIDTNTINSKEFIYVPEKSITGYLILKRIFDVILSIVGIIIISPILVLVAIAIKLDSPGKVIYTQNRVGENGKMFKMYKFRSMVSNSDEVFKCFSDEMKKKFEENYKLDKDPRITKIGTFIRKTSLDELPQLLNIIKGELSLVGPRPLVEKEIEKYGTQKDKFLSIKPGVTGYWQVNGRSAVTYKDRINMELFYIDNRSLLLDLKIVFLTIGTVLSRNGAK